MISTGGGGASGGCLPFQSMRGGRCTPAFADAFLPAGSPRDLAMAPDGSFYVVGLIEKATDFDPGSAVDMQAPAGVTDAFVTHFAADGSYLWTRTIGGATAHVGQTVAAVDAAGVLFLAGDYTGPVDLDPGPGTNLPPDGPRHSGGFVAKWDASGAFVAAVCFPGDPAGGIVQVNGLAMGARGEVQMAGVVQGKVDLHLPTGDGTVSIPSGEMDGFGLSLGPDLKTRWGVEFPHSDFADVSAVADGSVWFGGTFDGTVDFDPSAATNNQTSAGERDGIVLRVDAAGALLSATRAGGTSFEYITGVSAAADGSVYVLGSAYPGGFQVGGVTPSTPVDQTDIFFARLNPDGTTAWVDVLGGPGSDTPARVLATADGVIALGSAESANVKFDRAGTVPWAAKMNSGFITRRRADGSHVSTIGFGGSAYFVPQWVALSASSMVIMGLYGGTPDLDPGPGTFTFPMAENTFWVARFDL